MKKLKLTLMLFAATLPGLIVAEAFAQEKKPNVLKYVAPKYPPAARAVRATGTVVITVEIDKDGKVMTAIAENGHPLLRKACENAAKGWIFSRDATSEMRKIAITFVMTIGKKEKEKVRFRKPYKLEVTAARPVFN